MPFRGYNRQSGFGAFAEGIGTGLRNIAAIRGIQKSQEDEARALRGEARQGELDKLRTEEAGQKRTSFNQQQEEYKRLHDRTIDPETVIEGMGLDDEGKNYVRNAAKPFMPAGGKLSLVDLATVRDNVMKDPKVVSEINNHRRRSIGNQITSLEEELATMGSDVGGGLGQVAAFNQKKAQLAGLKTRMQELDPNWDKREDNARKDKELGFKEREVAVKEKGEHAVSNLPAMRDKLSKMPDGLQKEAYRKLIADQENFEIKEKGTTARATVDRFDERERIKEKNAAIKAETDRVNKYYPELKKSLEDEKKQLMEENPENPDIGVINRALANLSTHHSRDLQYVAQGKEPPGVAALEAWRSGETPAAKAVPGKPASGKSAVPPPKEGDTFTGKKGKYTFRNGQWGIETGTPQAKPKENSAGKGESLSTWKPNQARSISETIPKNARNDEKPVEGYSRKQWGMMSEEQKERARQDHQKRLSTYLGRQ